MVDSVLEVQNIKLPDSGGTTGADVFTSTGNVATIASGVVFPSGHIINVWSNYESSEIVIANSGGLTTNSDSLTNVHTTNRVYSKILSVTVNIASGNDMIVMGWVGSLGGYNVSDKGSFGNVFKIPDSSGNNRGYEGSKYPHYPANNIGHYRPDWSGMILVGEESGDTIATGDIEVSIYGYAYNEASPSSSENYGIGKRYIQVMEVQR